MAILMVEDKTGNIEVVAFPKKYAELKDLFKLNVPIGFIGRLNKKDDFCSVILTKMKKIDLEKHGDNFNGVTFKINDIHNGDDLKDLKEKIKKNPGDCCVRIVIHKKNDKKVMLLNHKVEKNPEILECIKRFGSYD